MGAVLDNQYGAGGPCSVSAITEPSAAANSEDLTLIFLSVTAGLLLKRWASGPVAYSDDMLKPCGAPQVSYCCYVL